MKSFGVVLVFLLVGSLVMSKSRILIYVFVCGLVRRKMFAGFRSWCMMLCVCAVTLGDHVVVDAGDGADNHNDNNDADDDGNHDVSVSNGRGGMRQLPLV